MDSDDADPANAACTCKTTAHAGGLTMRLDYRFPTIKTA